VTFREAFLTACELNPKAVKGRAKLFARLRAADPRLKPVRNRWARIEKKVAARYRKETGKEVGDWRDVLDWLIANLPAILQILMTILTLF
jgi:hypothetical protein